MRCSMLVLAGVLSFSLVQVTSAESFFERLAGTWEAELEKHENRAIPESLKNGIGKPLSELGNVRPWGKSKKATATLAIDRNGACKMTLNVAGKTHVRRQNWQIVGNDRDSAEIKAAENGKAAGRIRVKRHNDNQFQLQGSLIDQLFAKSPARFRRSGVYDDESAHRQIVGTWRVEFVPDEVRIKERLKRQVTSSEEIETRAARLLKQLSERSITFSFEQSGRCVTAGVENRQTIQRIGEWELLTFHKAEPPLFPHPEIVIRRRDNDGKAETKAFEIIDNRRMLNRRLDGLPIRAMVLIRQAPNRTAKGKSNRIDKTQR